MLRGRPLPLKPRMQLQPKQRGNKHSYCVLPDARNPAGSMAIQANSRLGHGSPEQNADASGPDDSSLPAMNGCVSRGQHP